jgi:hypothetical protein
VFSDLIAIKMSFHSRFMLRLTLYGGTDCNLLCPDAMPGQNKKRCEADELSWKLEFFLL